MSESRPPRPAHGEWTGGCLFRRVLLARLAWRAKQIRAGSLRPLGAPIIPISRCTGPIPPRLHHAAHAPRTAPSHLPCLPRACEQLCCLTLYSCTLSQGRDHHNTDSHLNPAEPSPSPRSCSALRESSRRKNTIAAFASGSNLWSLTCLLPMWMMCPAVK